MLKDLEVDAVIITTPTDLHESYVRRSLNKAVFCEKPVCAGIDAIKDCYDLANKVKLPLFCAFNRRFDPAISKLREQVREGKVGKVYHVKMTSRDAPLPSIDYLKISNGIFHDCGVHDIDVVCLVVGEKPVGVFAQGSAFDPEIRAIGDLDTVAIVLKFPSGALASIELNRHSHDGYDQRLEVKPCITFKFQVRGNTLWEDTELLQFEAAFVSWQSFLNGGGGAWDFQPSAEVSLPSSSKELFSVQLI